MSGRTIIDNRKARHEFEFLEKYEAGIELVGTEVKSLRAGKASLVDAYARIEGGQVWLYNLHISHYDFGNINNHEEKRPRAAAQIGNCPALRRCAGKRPDIGAGAALLQSGPG